MCVCMRMYTRRTRGAERRDAGLPLSRRAEERASVEAHDLPSSRKEKNSRSARSRSRVESLAFRELSTLHLSLAHERTATDPAKEK